MKADQEIKISISEINEVSYKQSHSPIPMEEIVFGQNLIFGLGFNFEVDFDKSNFIFSTLVRFIVEGYDEPVIELETEIVFEVINLVSVVKKMEGGEIELEDKFLATLAGVCIGTSRGILAKNTKGTPFAKYPLPILNPTEIIRDMKRDTNSN